MNKLWSMLVILLAPVCFATTYVANSTSQSDVQAAINMTVDGDTVTVPAGTSIWSTQVTISDAITLQGAGTNSTFITSGLGPGLSAISDNHGELRITGFNFNGNGTETFGPVTVTGTGVRVDDCLFTNCALFSLESYNAFGVIDHCTFKESDGGIYVQNPAYGGNSYGDGSWTNGDNFGTTNFMYIESCSFVGVGQVGCMDGAAGARWVFRYNYVTNDVLVAHGTDSTGRPRGTRAVEVYENNMYAPPAGSWSQPFELRSGVGLIWSNQCYGYAGGNFTILKEFRYTNSDGCGVGGTYPPWGPCNGTDPWDGNTSGNGYPAIDQCGRGAGDLLADNAPSSGEPWNVTDGNTTNWPHQVVDPVYQWGNYDGATLLGFGQCGPSGLFTAGLDYSNAVKAGYAALVYPHPLVQAATNSPAPPSPASGSGGRGGFVPGGQFF